MVYYSRCVNYNALRHTAVLLAADIHLYILHFATVAQLVEQLIRNQQVGGSSPPSSSKTPVNGQKCPKQAFFCT